MPWPEEALQQIETINDIAYAPVISKTLISKDCPFFDLITLANFLDEDVTLLRWLASDYNYVWSRYKTFWIDKNSGKIVPYYKGGRLRKIEAPDASLKELQVKLNRVFSLFPIHPANCAFVQGKGIIDAVQNVHGKDLVIHLDLKDFFTNHTSLYIKNKLEQLLSPMVPDETRDQILKILLILVTRDYHLPQGSPCSPLLTVVLNYDMDRKIHALAAKYGLAYSRYADDLLFAGEITDTHAKEFLDELPPILHPFQINYKKLCLMRNKAYPSFRGIQLTAKAVKVIPTQQSALIITEIKKRLSSKVEKYTQGTVLVKGNRIIIPVTGKIKLEEVKTIVQELQTWVSTKYPKSDFTVKPLYFYIQQYQQALGLHLHKDGVKYPRKLYEQLRLEAMLLGIQQGYWVAIKLAERYSLPHIARYIVNRGTPEFSVLPKKYFRNLVVHPFSKRSFSGKISYLRSIDAKKADKLVSIVERHKRNTIERLLTPLVKFNDCAVVKFAKAILLKYTTNA